MHWIGLLALAVASALSPTKTWFPPDAPLTVSVASKAEGDRLVLTKFGGVAELAAKDVTGDSTPDLKQLFPALKEAGTYVLYLVPKGKSVTEFEGTPLVVRVVVDARQGPGAAPMVVKVEPLRYAVMTTKQGPITMAFYYDVAPNTVTSFLTLSEQGYFDGLAFHRIVPKFVIQGGDPRGDGTGGPGYNLQEEFNDRPHHAGVLSMARSQDVNGAGSQFFICLDYAQTRQLDGKYTAFGKVTDGMDAVKALGSVPVGENDKPTQPQAIEKVEVKPVTAADNPYAKLFKELEPAK